jgi:hypothetical protein
MTEILLHSLHLMQDGARMFGKAERVRSRRDFAACADEEFHFQSGAHGTELLAYGSGAEAHAFGCPGDAGGIHHSEEDA